MGQTGFAGPVWPFHHNRTTNKEHCTKESIRSWLRQAYHFRSLITEILFHPPYWVHAALWLPLIIVVTLGPLRPMKGLMIALQYHHKAAESRFGGEES